MGIQPDASLHYSQPPQSYKCPLSGKVMEDPVMDLCAHNFDREAITDFLVDDCHCPISRKPLHPDDLVSNHSLAEQIEQWTFRKEHAIHKRELADEEATSALSDEEDQMEKGNRRTMRGPHKKTALYSRIPSELMLLPQERKILASVRTKAAERRSLRQTRRCYRMSCTLVGFLIIGTVALIAWRSRRAEEEEDQL